MSTLRELRVLPTKVRYAWVNWGLRRLLLHVIEPLFFMQWLCRFVDLPLQNIYGRLMS